MVELTGQAEKLKQGDIPRAGFVEKGKKEADKKASTAKWSYQDRIRGDVLDESQSLLYR